MNFIQKLEQKFGRYAINNLTMYLVIASIIGFMLPDALAGLMRFNVAGILQGEVWRIITWIFIPASYGGGTINKTLGIIFLLCLIPMGKQLEMYIGSFRVNVLLIGGLLLSEILGFLSFFVFQLPIYLTTYYLLLSIFMALALCFPDAQINLYFVIPIKMKWILIFYIVDMVYSLGSLLLQGGLIYLVVYGTSMIAALVNIGLFFLFVLNNRVSFKQKKRQKAYHTQMNSNQGQHHTNVNGHRQITKHKCAICGRTELDDPNLEFRFCSKCDGNYEYCQDHLFTHTHVKH